MGFSSPVPGENERYAAARFEMDLDQEPVAQQPSTIHRKPVHSSTPIDTPRVASVALTSDLSSQSSAEKPLPAVLPIVDKGKLEPAPSLESGSIAPYISTTKPTLKQRFDTLMPPHKTYFGRFTRRAFLFILLGLLLLVILVIGLGAGLGGKKSGSKTENKPLPPGQIQTGELTYYDPGGPGYGSCGEIHYADDAICAVSHLVYDSVATSKNPNENVLCGRMIRVSRVDERDGKRKSVDCKVVDRCEGCKAEDVDLSPGMYNMIAAEELGRVRGEWAWLD